jgi:hypothetical protein
MNGGAPGSYPPLHNSRYNFNEAALETGIRLMTSLAFKALK